MNLYAKVKDGLVINVIMADYAFIASHVEASSFHLLNEDAPAAIGWSYDAVNDVFVAPTVEEWQSDDN